STPADARAAFRERAERRRFQRTWLTVVAALAVAAAALGVASVTQGPRLSSAAFNAGAAVERSGQRLVLQADQPLVTVDADAVTVEPEAPVELSSEGARLTVRVTGTLRHASEYRVRVAVRSAATGAESRLDYRFATPDVATFSLVRHHPGDGGTDRIVRHSLSGDTADATMLEAPRIQEYVPVGEAIAAVVLDESDVP